MVELISYQWHQCDKRLFLSIHESIRYVDAHEINLLEAHGAAAHTTNFIKYGETISESAGIQKTRELVEANSPQGLFVNGEQMSFHQLDFQSLNCLWCL